MLQETEKYLEKAISLSKTNADYLNELGAEKLHQQKYKDAVKCFNSVMKIDPANITALLGKLKCQIIEDKLDDVEPQIELLTETMKNMPPNPVGAFSIRSSQRVVYRFNFSICFLGISVHKSLLQ